MLLVAATRGQGFRLAKGLRVEVAEQVRRDRAGCGGRSRGGRRLKSSLSEVGATLAVGAALWRYNKLTQENSLLLESKIDEGEILSKEEDFVELEEAESLERISSAFLTGLSCFPYLNWLPWLFLMSRGNQSQAQGQGQFPASSYYLCCSVLYAIPYLDLFGQRDLATSIDYYVLVLGILHLQLERSITRVVQSTQRSVQQQWINYDYDKNNSSSNAGSADALEERNKKLARTVLGLDPEEEEKEDRGEVKGEEKKDTK